MTALKLDLNKVNNAFKMIKDANDFYYNDNYLDEMADRYSHILEDIQDDNLEEIYENFLDNNRVDYELVKKIKLIKDVKGIEAASRIIIESCEVVAISDYYTRYNEVLTYPLCDMDDQIDFDSELNEMELTELKAMLNDNNLSADLCNNHATIMIGGCSDRITYRVDENSLVNNLKEYSFPSKIVDIAQYNNVISLCNYKANNPDKIKNIELSRDADRRNGVEYGKLLSFNRA